jgi:hypothetical protein
MPTPPRIVLTVFAAHANSMEDAWQRFSREVTSGSTWPRGLQAGGRTRSGDPAGAKAFGPAGTDLRDWGESRPAVDSEPASSPRGVWRLLASNNREIARSSRIYVSSTEARSDIDRICLRWDELAVTEVVGRNRGMRGWYARLAEEPVITCSRWYETSSSSFAASQDATEAMQIAVLSDAVRKLEAPDQSRRRQGARLTTGLPW